MLKVYARRDREPTFVWLYWIYEDEQGRLRWYYDTLENACVQPDGTTVYVLDMAGYLSYTDVTEKDAEIITGLHMPAAMDRLRELVQEAR